MAYEKRHGSRFAYEGKPYLQTMAADSLAMPELVLATVVRGSPTSSNRAN